MELVGGGDLRQAILASRLSREERLRIILEVGEALAFAHAKGVIHRDVKPANVLLDSTGRPKLSDFDLVRAAASTGGTRTTGLGTFLYAAPEAMLDAKESAEPADVYGLGMTAIFALYGADLPSKILRNPEFVVATLTVDDSCRNALRRAVAWEVEDRWPTVVDFCRALQKEQESPSSEPSTPAQRQIWADPVLGIEFVYIEPGEFWMGSPEGEEGRNEDERRHRVKLTQGYWMASTPVTEDQFAKFVEVTGYETEAEKEGKSWRQSGGAEYPVVNVSWNDVMRFCEWLSGQVGEQIRLPTEAEWEYAARAGTETAIYAPKLDDIGWYRENSGHRAHPVGTRQPNAWGLYDMLGNVWEWVADWYQEYPEGDVVDPRGPERGLLRVYRGGSWYSFARSVRAAYRFRVLPSTRWDDRGFRLARGQGGEAEAAEPPDPGRGAARGGAAR